MNVKLQKNYRSTWHAHASIDSAVNRILNDLLEIKHASEWLYQKASAKEENSQEAQPAQEKEQEQQAEETGQEQ